MCAKRSWCLPAGEEPASGKLQGDVTSVNEQDDMRYTSRGSADTEFCACQVTKHVKRKQGVCEPLGGDSHP